MAEIDEDVRMVRALGDAYTGELEGISDYIYYHILTGTAAPEESEIFEQHALDEMRHFQALGELIQALGGSPAVNVRLRNPPYNLTDDIPSRMPVAVIRMLEASLRDEEAGTENYRELIKSSQDSTVRSVLNAILRDEEEHINHLRKQLIKRRAQR